MDEYIILLALTYFKEAKGRYTISEFAKKLGYTHKRIEELTFYLLSNGYLEYSDDLLQISKKGLTLLIANEMEESTFLNEQINLIHINSENAIGITEPYVPKDFAKKYDG